MGARQLAHTLRARRHALHLTQPDLADRAGVSLSYVCMLERDGAVATEVAPLARVAQVLGYHHLVALLDEVSALDGTLPPSVRRLATAEQVARFLRALPP